MTERRQLRTIYTRRRAAALAACLGVVVLLHEAGALEFSKPAWAIGMCAGTSPFVLDCAAHDNPVLTARDVTDVRAAFVADPFMVHDFNQYFMFFEVMDSATGRAGIGLATSATGSSWEYKRTVLTEPFMLSYPYVFKWDGQYYMLPETHQANAVRLYRAAEFPNVWSFVGNLVTGRPLNDPSIVRVNDRWWLFAGERDDTLRLYHADTLTGPWVEHPKSPIISGDPARARPGGRLLPFKGRLFRMAQRDRPNYGNQVRVFEVVELSTSDYKETELPESPILRGTGRGWNKAGMHHADIHQMDEHRWLACVDGYRWVRTVKLRWPFPTAR
jgi:hypothetical protein